MDIETMRSIMVDLAEQYHLFHSELDLQHALAWQIHLEVPTARVHLAVPLRSEGRSRYIDILVRASDRVVGVELKYKSRRLKVSDGGECYNLTQQQAQDLGRYDFFKDVKRLEEFVSSRTLDLGIALFLTNDRTYWTPRANCKAGDWSFDMSDGRRVSGTLEWGPTMKRARETRDDPVRLSGSYTLEWSDYWISDLPGAHVEFRYVTLLVSGAPAVIPSAVAAVVEPEGGPS